MGIHSIFLHVCTCILILHVLCKLDQKSDTVAATVVASVQGVDVWSSPHSLTMQNNIFMLKIMGKDLGVFQVKL